MLSTITSFFSSQAVMPVAASIAANQIAESNSRYSPKASDSDANFEDNAVQRVVDEMNRRNNIAYGIGVGLRRFFGTDTDESRKTEDVSHTLVHRAVENIKRDQEQKEVSQEVSKKENIGSIQNITVPFTTVYQKMFPQDTLRVLYMELDPGVDDGAALLQLLAAISNNSHLKIGKKVEIAGIVPCVGNAILAQTEQNTQQFLELTRNQDINVYPGAVAPLAIENNQTAINEMNQGINATHFYGHDGEADVGGWPKVTMPLQSTPGYQFAASRISQAPPDAPYTLVSTSALTELSKTLSLLEQMDAQQGLPAGSFSKNINAISIMGGCLNPAMGCNAPFNVPDSQKTSEANFYFDSPAASNVFAICQKYGIPILLAPLDLTQQPGLLWTKEQVNMINQTNNAVGQQFARVTNVVPYLDAPCFPNGTYPMHDLQAVTDILFPDFYNVTAYAFSIGDIGQIILDPNATEAQKNVYVLSMPPEKQSVFYQTVLKEYQNFDSSNSTQWSKGKVIGLIASGLALIGMAAVSACTIAKCKRDAQNPSQPANEETNLLTDKAQEIV